MVERRLHIYASTTTLSFHCLGTSSEHKKIKGIFLSRESLRIYEVGNKKRLVQHCWKSWKFEMKIMDLKKRCRNSWSLRSVR